MYAGNEIKSWSIYCAQDSRQTLVIHLLSFENHRGCAFWSLCLYLLEGDLFKGGGGVPYLWAPVPWSKIPTVLLLADSGVSHDCSV